MRFFTIGRNYRTVIEIGKSYLKVSQAGVSGKGIVLSRLITKPISDISDDEIAKMLANLISTNNISLDDLTVIITRDRAMVRYIRLPATRAEEIESMISYEVARQIPYSQEEIISDYEIINTDTEGYSEVMLTIVHKDEIARIYNILSSVEKRQLKIRLSSEAVLAWLKVVAGDQLNQKSICLLDVDADSTEIAVISDGKLGFSRVASIGAADISQTKSEADVWKRRLVDEIRSSIGIYIKEKGQSASVISEFLITGANSIRGLGDLIQEQMDTSCRTLNILSTLPLADGTLTEEGISSDGSVSACCGGLFLSEGVNLIPQELRSKEKAKVKARRLVTILISAVAGMVLLSAVALARLYEKERRLARVKNLLKQTEPQTRATEDKLKKLRMVKQQLSEGTASLDVIYHLYRLVPANISLVDFDYEDKERTVRFRGTTTKMSDVFNLATILEESETFSNVQTGSVSKRRTRQGEGIDFQIRCNFVGTAPKHTLSRLGAVSE